MKATVIGKVIADSDDTIKVNGYDYFPLAAVRTEWLEKAPRTAKDLACPHGVQFYDIVINGERHPRNAWIYERPQPSMMAVVGRVGFWENVKVS